MTDLCHKDFLLNENTSMPLLIPVILSGGTGSRLWPVSREDHPKPFIKLVDGQSFLEKAYRRAKNIIGTYSEDGKARILTVTNRNYYFMSRDELDKAGATGGFLLEPCGRNTAPAIALAALQIRDQYGPDALMLILPADHLISNEVEFALVVSEAVRLASAPHNLLVTFGVLPTSPETGFGYIEVGNKNEGGQKVKAFVEKPDVKTAQAYLDSGRYLWNSGMFCFSAEQILKQIQLHAPLLASAAKACWETIQSENPKDLDMIEIPENAFSVLPDISIDYAVMEKSSEVAVIPCDMGWSDIGSWAAIQNLIEPDQNNNRTNGDTIFIKSCNTYVQSDGRLVATLGVDNLLVIDTKDALLIANSTNAQEVKAVVDILKQKKHEAYKSHNTVARPWGIYTILEEGPGFKIKRIEVRPGARLSLQSHKFRSEHWVVVKGQARILNGNTDVTILVNQSTYIPAGHKHRLENASDEDLVMIEVQCGEYLGEDDIVRYEDNYGRT